MSGFDEARWWERHTELANTRDTTPAQAILALAREAWEEGWKSSQERYASRGKAAVDVRQIQFEAREAEAKRWIEQLNEVIFPSHRRALESAYASRDTAAADARAREIAYACEEEARGAQFILGSTAVAWRDAARLSLSTIKPAPPPAADRVREAARAALVTHPAEVEAKQLREVRDLMMAEAGRLRKELSKGRERREEIEKELERERECHKTTQNTLRWVTKQHDESRASLAAAHDREIESANRLSGERAAYSSTMSLLQLETKEVARLRAALERIRAMCVEHSINGIGNIAGDALEAKP